MELEDDSSTNFMPEHLLRILTAIESNGTHLPWKLIRNSSSFTLIVNFSAKGKGNDKEKQPPLKKRVSGVNLASQRTDKKRQDSSDDGLAKEEEDPSSSGKGSCSTKSLLEEHQSCQEAENFAAHRAKLWEAGKEASLQFYTVVSQPENSGCLERTYTLSLPAQQTFNR